MNVAVYGGSFNPPHIGHAMVISWLLWTKKVDQVWLLPTFAHAFGKPLAPFERRIAMCSAMAAEIGPAVVVNEIESTLPVPSFSIDTLRALAATHPHSFRLVVGADVIPETPQWKQWDAIEAEFTPIIVGRTGYPPINGAVSFPDVSSTEIRARIARGEPVNHLVLACVHRLLEGLYAEPEAA